MALIRIARALPITESTTKVSSTYTRNKKVIEKVFLCQSEKNDCELKCANMLWRLDSNWLRTPTPEFRVLFNDFSFGTCGSIFWHASLLSFAHWWLHRSDLRDSSTNTYNWPYWGAKYLCKFLLCFRKRKWTYLSPLFTSYRAKLCVTVFITHLGS